LDRPSVVLGSAVPPRVIWPLMTLWMVWSASSPPPSPARPPPAAPWPSPALAGSVQPPDQNRHANATIRSAVRGV